MHTTIRKIKIILIECVPSKDGNMVYLKSINVTKISSIFHFLFVSIEDIFMYNSQ